MTERSAKSNVVRHILDLADEGWDEFADERPEHRGMYSYVLLTPDALKRIKQIAALTPAESAILKDTHAAVIYFPDDRDEADVVLYRTRRDFERAWGRIQEG